MVIIDKSSIVFFVGVLSCTMRVFVLKSVESEVFLLIVIVSLSIGSSCY